MAIKRLNRLEPWKKAFCGREELVWRFWGRGFYERWERRK
jgi:hypothetical protein